MRKTLGVATYHNGVGYYRMSEPFRVLKEQGEDVQLNPFSFTGEPKNGWLQAKPKELEMDYFYRVGSIFEKKMKDVKAVIWQKYDNPAYFALSMGLREFYKVPVIQELDDYNFDVPETNPGKKSYHEKELYNIEADDAMMWSRKSLGQYDAYIVTTKFLQDFYGNYSPTYLCPNSIDLRKRQFGPHKKHKEIRIGFSASGGHQEGQWFLDSIMEKILKKYPEVVYYKYFGVNTKLNKRKFPKRIKEIQWKNVDKYPKYLHSLDLDIALAPLVDRLFNRAKSNLRLLEYWSAGKYPIVASRVGEYKRTITDGKNGLLATTEEEWIDKISKLVEDEKLRRKLGEEGYKTVEKDFNLEKNVKYWKRAVDNACRDFDPDREISEEYLNPAARYAKQNLRPE